MATNPDETGVMADRGVATNDNVEQAIALMPGESTISPKQLAAHYLMMTFEQRGQLFTELLITHGAKGVTMARDVYNEAIKLYGGQR